MSESEVGTQWWVLAYLDSRYPNGPYSIQVASGATAEEAIGRVHPRAETVHIKGPFRYPDDFAEYTVEETLTVRPVTARPPEPEESA
jgi:hypothetical protein